MKKIDFIGVCKHLSYWSFLCWGEVALVRGFAFMVGVQISLQSLRPLAQRAYNIFLSAKGTFTEESGVFSLLAC
jgi:hypothetical protein